VNACCSPISMRIEQNIQETALFVTDENARCVTAILGNIVHKGRLSKVSSGRVSGKNGDLLSNEHYAGRIAAAR